MHARLTDPYLTIFLVPHEQ